MSWTGCMEKKSVFVHASNKPLSPFWGTTFYRPMHLPQGSLNSPFLLFVSHFDNFPRNLRMIWVWFDISWPPPLPRFFSHQRIPNRFFFRRLPPGFSPGALGTQVRNVFLQLLPGLKPEVYWPRWWKQLRSALEFWLSDFRVILGLFWGYFRVMADEVMDQW